MTSVAETRRRKAAAREAKAAGILPDREPNGRATRKEADAAVSVVAERRCRERGIAPTAANRRAVLDPNEGFMLGRLYIRGMFGKPDEDKAKAFLGAGKRYAAVEQAYRLAKGLPPRSAQSASYGAVRGGSENWDPDSRKAAMAAHASAQAVLRECGPHVLPSVEDVCCDDRLPHSGAGLLAGLEALAEHFGMQQKA
ncbi:hypothetical protein [Albimonas pacifica]|uniref:Uncharacterized protein n=1 Tax=Albimonas pacifica TaxID=1114924 RepID=A0A1I3LHU3_9RHOB|nr:hypothetical protein [Albimonas pacifica]SFI84006.1 hypothetical protein SAMN05216258_11024 [Albimonas pacifica]